MNERQENGMIAIAVGVLFIIIALLAFTSCATKKKVVKELEYVHDTLFISHTDTFMVERWNTRHDTVQMLTERVVTLMQNDKTLPADTIKVVVNNDRYHYAYVKDSTMTARSVVDSLLKVLDQRHESEKMTVKTEPPWIQRLIFLLIIGLIVFIILKWK